MIREEILKMPVVVEDAHSLDMDNRIYILQYFINDVIIEMIFELVFLLKEKPLIFLS